MKLREEIHKSITRTGCDSWLFIQYTNSRCLWIRKNKYTNESNKQPTRFWSVLFVWQRLVWSKVSVSNQKTARCWFKTFLLGPQGLHWILEWYERCLQEYWRLQSRKEKKWLLILMIWLLIWVVIRNFIQ